MKEAVEFKEWTEGRQTSLNIGNVLPCRIKIPTFTFPQQPQGILKEIRLDIPSKI